MAENATSLNTFFAPPPSAPIKPYTGTFGRKQLLHLLRRTLFGVSNTDLKAFEGKTLDQVVTALLDVTDFNPAPPLNDYAFTRGIQAYEKDKDGKFILDKDNNKILAFVKNADGTYKLNANGSKIPIMEQPVMANSTDPDAKFGETWVNAATNGGNVDGQRRQSFKAWWAGLMMQQERNLREKMTLFYANHFSMEADVVNSAIYTYRSNQLTRKHSLGNFKDLIRDITTDTGMLVYLNGNRNVKAAPDENYARELQELFTIGKRSDMTAAEAQLIEQDVKAAAKILTGWNTNRGKPNEAATFNPKNHDTSDKTFSTFFGSKVIKGDATANGGQNEINAMLDMIFAHSEVAKFMVRKLYVFFVYHTITPEVETNVIAPLADLFRTSKYDIKPVLKALFTSDDFYKASNMGAMIKSPLDHIVGIIRQFEISVPTDPTLFEAQYMIWRTATGFTTSLGQNIQDPPNVAGWPAYYQAPFYYDIWLDTATYPRRHNLQQSIANNGVATTGNEINIVNPQARGISFKINYATWLKGFANPTSSLDLISDLAELFYGVPISQTVKDRLRNEKLWKAKGVVYTITKDKEWSDAVTAYLANPATTEALPKSVPLRMQSLVAYMLTAGELQLH
jgi:uncharacterized protein (DUF1800 family)